MSADRSTRVENRIGEVRRKRALDQTDVARLAGIERWVFNRIENGIFLPTTVQLESIAEALGVTDRDLYGETALQLIRESERVA